MKPLVKLRSPTNEEDRLKEVRSFLDYLVQLMVEGKDRTREEQDKFWPIQCKYGISYLQEVLEYECLLAEGKRTGPVPKYFVMDAMNTEAALGKRCELTGVLASGGRSDSYRYDEFRQEERRAFVEKYMSAATIDEAQMKALVNEERMRKINRVRLVNNGREIALTGLERQWRSRGVPKKMRRTGDEKDIETLLNEMVLKTVKSIRDSQRHLEKKAKKDGNAFVNPRCQQIDEKAL
jgi:hypothetical protein